MRAVFTCADEIWLSNLKKSSFLPRTQIGALLPPSRPSNFAPSALSGSQTRLIGRSFKYLSPLSVKKPSTPQRSPKKSRIEVPEFPHSKTQFGSVILFGIMQTRAPLPPNFVKISSKFSAQICSPFTSTFAPKFCVISRE